MKNSILWTGYKNEKMDSELVLGIGQKKRIIEKKEKKKREGKPVGHRSITLYSIIDDLILLTFVSCSESIYML